MIHRLIDIVVLSTLFFDPEHIGLCLFFGSFGSEWQWSACIVHI